MSRVAFISDIDTPLGLELARCYIRDENRVFATTSASLTGGPKGGPDGGTRKPAEKRSQKTAEIPGEGDSESTPAERGEEPWLEEELRALREGAVEALAVEEWNRSSPISAKSMFLKALNRFDTVDEVLLLGDPHLALPPLDEVSYEMIERTVDCWVKGNLFLLKNVLSRYLKTGAGTLALVNTRFHEEPSPLEEAIQRSFMGITRSLLTAYGDRGINVVAFESTDDHVMDFAGYIYKSLTDRSSRSSGRWLRYKKGLFGGL